MERLKSAFLLTILALAAVPAVGQQTAPRDMHAGVVAVIGDIERCDTYPVPTGTALTVRQAVMQAGLLSESVNVTVIRAAHDRAQWTQIVSATSADDGEPVESGDVLVVQSMSPLTTAVRKNAALRTDTGVVIVGLEQDGIVIGDVLQTTNNLPLEDGQLKVICRFPGKTPIAKAELYHPVLHGDVISIASSGRTVLKGFGSMVPTVSEWKSSSPRTSQPVQAPLSTEAPMSLAIPDADATDADFTEEDADAESPASVVPTLTISQSDDVADAGVADNKMSFASESTTVAPVAPTDVQIGSVTSGTASAFNPWNLVFIGGLLLAGTLILAGTLKPEPDDNTEFSNAATKASTLIATGSDSPIAPQRTFSERPRWQDMAVSASETAQISVAIESPEAPASETRATMSHTAQIPVAAEQPTQSLIAGDEWFSDDWHGKVVSRNRESEAESSIAVTETSSSRSEEIDAALELYRNTIAAEPQKHAVSEVFEVESVQSPTADDQSFADLEDLLQNRLPIDLCETQLPLRVVLFGKPAGPRRLRIDAAHSSVPAPHMNLSADKRREQPVAATTATAHTPTSADSSGSLDRALHYLQERTES
ncbi:MAG: hypothetical protein H7Z17_07645 [Fuerstia sp.]|nr:hypothetical protein [Fuerstiella sp.]